MHLILDTGVDTGVDTRVSLLLLKLKCVAPVWASVRRTFAHSIFEGSPSKEGFHGAHGTPSGSATALY